MFSSYSESSMTTGNSNLDEDFSIADLSDEVYTDNLETAQEMYANNTKPVRYSRGICDTITAGYGRFDVYGYYEFPLEVDQDTLEIII